MNYKDLTKEYIEEQLYKNNKTLNSLARELNIKIPTLRWKAKKLGVKTRSVSETNKFLFEKQITREQLEQLYVTEKKTLKEISLVLKVSQSLLCKKLKEYNIKARNQTDYSPWNKGLTGDKRCVEACKIARKSIHTPIWNRGLTKETDERVAKQVEKLSAIRKVIFKGEGNPFYNKKHTEEWKKEQSLRKGGTGVPYEFDEYGSEFNDVLKEAIRNRDNRKCRNCGCDERDCYRSLDVHHIDYDKKNCRGNNLISLCPSCHTATNTNREYWKIVLTNKVSERILF
jgi:hypothetical protein